ncbi:MATE family efflux transporter [Natrialbaceae archaeon AArc-T1-2]|uniref:MATE family efflux transporter n=1 Tax=Natrialbaceae archaeon AArc-T1-2 TaxID=3053904 RepID=UPI00255B2B80|nr:MATE family efflux transporter [Natrialbaceae archaeon AArc-T1-2]WIV67687.1 MATE family efflux transporter [Natrialbaceae archaeon AArc-T1-2]
MARRFPNPIRLTILWIGLALARLGLIERERARRTTDLAWPRIVTGLARMSKNAVDVAMVGIAVGSAAIAGVGFASPFWGLAFSVGGGLAGGTIALVSQRYGAEAYDGLGQAVRSSIVLVLVATIPLTAAFWLYATELIGLLTDNPEALELGATYLAIVGVGIPFAGLNLVGSRTFVGMDDAWTPMVVRAGGAVANVVLNAVLIFGFGLGVAGAALGTVLANAVVTATFAVAFATGQLPGIGRVPVTVDPTGTYLAPGTMRDLVTIGVPVMGRNLVWRVAEFPLLAIVDVFGQDTVAAYVIARRIWDLMGTPGWGFGLASSSLVGQELGAGDERTAEQYGREIIRFAVAVYAVSAAIVFAFAEPITLVFTDDPTDLAVPTAVSLVHAACIAVVLQAISRGSSGPLNASGDTRWPFYSQVLGMFGAAIPLVYLGAYGLTVPGIVTIPPLGLWGLYLAFFAETAVPAAVNYYRFTTGKWKAISRSYRPDVATGDD